MKERQKEVPDVQLPAAYQTELRGKVALGVVDVDNSTAFVESTVVVDLNSAR